jgi:hypothetical protein
MATSSRWTPLRRGCCRDCGAGRPGVFQRGPGIWPKPTISCRKPVASVLARVHEFNPHHEAALSVYLREALANRLREGSSCLAQPGHAVLAPINTDGTSVFKRNSTVPVKFRVCDANGVSIGAAGVVSDFQLVQVMTGTTAQAVNETVDSTNPDNAFRWDPIGRQWTFNLATRHLSADKTYVYRITLNDDSVIDFRFGLK